MAHSKKTTILKHLLSKDNYHIKVTLDFLISETSERESYIKTNLNDFFHAFSTIVSESSFDLCERIAVILYNASNHEESSPHKIYQDENTFIPLLIYFMNSPNSAIKMHSLSAIHNLICYKNDNLISMIHKKGGVAALLSLCQEKKKDLIITALISLKKLTSNNDEIKNTFMMSGGVNITLNIFNSSEDLIVIKPLLMVLCTVTTQENIKSQFFHKGIVRILYNIMDRDECREDCLCILRNLSNIFQEVNSEVLDDIFIKIIRNFKTTDNSKEKYLSIGIFYNICTIFKKKKGDIINKLHITNLLKVMNDFPEQTIEFLIILSKDESFDINFINSLVSYMKSANQDVIFKMLDLIETLMSTSTTLNRNSKLKLILANVNESSMAISKKSEELLKHLESNLEQNLPQSPFSQLQHEVAVIHANELNYSNMDD